MLRLRNSKALFPVDFWGDAPYVGGCIAGKHYMHINSEGWVEPCIFTHFATDNIHDTSLADAFNSPYFREIRSRQPFSHNLLMPCMLIDNPTQSREIMAATGAQPTHPGADVMITDLQDELDQYARTVDRLYSPIWSCLSAEKEDDGRRCTPRRPRSSRPRRVTQAPVRCAGARGVVRGGRRGRRASAARPSFSPGHLGMAALAPAARHAGLEPGQGGVA